MIFGSEVCCAGIASIPLPDFKIPAGLRGESELFSCIIFKEYPGIARPASLCRLKKPREMNKDFVRLGIFAVIGVPLTDQAAIQTLSRFLVPTKNVPCTRRWR